MAGQLFLDKIHQDSFHIILQPSLFNKTLTVWDVSLGENFVVAEERFLRNVDPYSAFKPLILPASLSYTSFQDRNHSFKTQLY